MEKKKNSDVAAGMAQQECSDSKYYVSAFKYIYIYIYRFNQYSSFRQLSMLLLITYHVGLSH